MYLKKNKVFLDIIVRTALVDMYMKRGRPDLARTVFIEMPERNVVAWNAMISGFATNGHGKAAIEMLHSMEQEDVPMDDLIFLGLLSACSHTSLKPKVVRYLKE